MLVCLRAYAEVLSFLFYATGLQPKGGEPGIKFLSLEPIRIVENHFSLPLAVTDQLTSPDGYPCPVVRLTLKEMSVIWSMYGGKDFEDKFVSNSLRKLGPQNRMNSAPGTVNLLLFRCGLSAALMEWR